MQMLILLSILLMTDGCRVFVTERHHGECEAVSTGRIVCQTEALVNPTWPCRASGDPCTVLHARVYPGKCRTVAGDRRVCVAGRYMDPFTTACG